MAGLELRNIAKSYGAVSVIEGVSLTVADGEFVALVGPSGCGKSTILRMIAGLEDISGGEIVIGSEVVNDLTPKERNIAMVFQSYALYPHMSVYRNMAFNLELAGKPRDEIDRRVQVAATMLELGPLLERKPSQLSGGQRQRVAMGRAVVRNPSVFLFDEPLSNLDAKLRVQMRSEIKQLHNKVGVTSVYVTHDQVEAMTLADRVVVLNRGVIQQSGSPMQLYREPANTFVAGFIGSPAMNLFDATIVNGTARTASGEAFVFEGAGKSTEGQSVTVGIRPEHFLRTGQGSSLTGWISTIEPTGGQTFVTVSIAGQPTVVTISGDDNVSPGDELTLFTTPRQVYVFDAASGQRISENAHLSA
ncbi:ABC transporter ATP-binding protein [Devosia sp.]|uniref:ABC transporter ATP-binding protein n=1 Tax=Devosia sp. TaxID=1871048 RepID=UPI002733A769|nr:sn-glycerol-3-phosphate ABC transporter ATP-binding protein UgpC [Devosia sp.]MDP2782715.1 sn-glycerol-3-phosphate ABC transporter ATP-binding protein UgpC [Devosia sp.]